jgi:threonyl-tRNA synthetase
MTVLKKFEFNDVTAQISLRHQTDREKYLGSEENWDKAERAIIEATAEAGLTTVTAYDEAAFYGPKLDFMIKDALGRSWQLGTIQVDYNLPERFELEYIGSDNQAHRPVMIHRAPFGSMERFMGVLIEHCAGKFPMWLAPDQFALLPVSERSVDYCNEIKRQLEQHDIRGYVDDRNETVGRKIRDTELKRIPMMMVIGDKEIEAGQISVRKQGDGDKGMMSVEAFVEYFKTLL